MTLGYHETRALTERLAAPLSAEDQTVQSMPDASPTKWHRAHTTWFFETFVLEPLNRCESAHSDHYGYLFNSYYEALGPRHARAERGLITRPGIEAIAAYRTRIDREITDLLDHAPNDAGVHDLVQLGLNHEQQHQELLIMDIKHALSRNPCRPCYGPLPWSHPAADPGDGWTAHDGGVVEIGHRGVGFGFDNEGPQHHVLLAPFAIADSLVTCGQWQTFMADGGYQRPDLWMADGWAAAQAQSWSAPAYWFKYADQWHVHDLVGVTPVNPETPVVHISWFEADAFARWAEARLPLEAEWEAVAPDATGRLTSGSTSWYGTAWQWTSSPYVAYPGFRPVPSAVGEYNGKFMVNQQVLRGGSSITPPGHARRSYRNFFPPHARWLYSGLRLARDDW